MQNILSRRTILITGGAGFIGANLTRKLVKQNYDVNLILKKSTDIWRLKDSLKKIKIFHIDLLKKNELTKIINKIKPNYIVHLATYGDYRNQSDVDNMTKTNIEATLNLLMASKNINYELFINTGSSSEYGIKNEPMKESDFLEPISFYAATKASVTHLCSAFAKEYGKSILTVRPFSVYGPSENLDRLIPTIIKSLRLNEPIKLTPGKERRDFVYMEDLVDLYLKAIKKGRRLGGEILNFGTGIEYTNDQVVDTLFKVARKKVLVKKGAYPARIWDMPHWVADISKTKKKLNWKPRFDLEKGLRKTYLWFKNNEK